MSTTQVDRSRISLAAAISLTLWSAQLAAQDSVRAELEEVVVTGSFLRGTPEDTAIPVEIVSYEEIQNMGRPSNLDLVKLMSESGGVAGENNRANFYPVGAATINLRSLGSRFTTVVFNGRRFPEQFSVNTGRFNNITWIPNAAVGSVETLKAGGAATYGADAIAGVVNYVTRKGFEGLELNGDYRYIDDSDGDYGVDALWGTNLAYGRRAAGLAELSASQRTERDRSRLDPAAHAGKSEQLAEPDVGHLQPRHGRISAPGRRLADFVHADTDSIEPDADERRRLDARRRLRGARRLSRLDQHTDARVLHEHSGDGRAGHRAEQLQPVHRAQSRSRRSAVPHRGARLSSGHSEHRARRHVREQSGCVAARAERQRCAARATEHQRHECVLRARHESRGREPAQRSAQSRTARPRSPRRRSPRSRTRRTRDASACRISCGSRSATAARRAATSIVRKDI